MLHKPAAFSISPEMPGRSSSGSWGLTRLAGLVLADRDHAGVGIEIIYPHRGKFRISAAGQQRTANKIAELRFAGID
jgi:hypothetical protein